MLAPRLCRFALSAVFVCTASGISFAQDEGERSGPPEESALRELKAELERVAKELVDHNREGRKDEAVAAERRVREVARKIEQVARFQAERKLEQAAKELLARAEKERAGGREDIARKLEDKARELGRKHAERDAKEIEKLEQKLAQAREKRNASREGGNEEETQKRQAVVDDLKERITAARARIGERADGEKRETESRREEPREEIARKKGDREDDDGDDDDDEERDHRESAERGALEKALADARARRDEVRASGNEEETAKAQAVVDELKARIAKGEGKPEREEGRGRQGGEGIELLRKEVQGLREHIHRIEEILARLEALERGRQ